MREVSEKKPFLTVTHVIKALRKPSNHVLQRKPLDAQSVEYIQDKDVSEPSLGLSKGPDSLR